MTLLLQQLANGLVVGSIYVLISLGLLLVFGVLDIPNFAHGQFVMIGAIVTVHFVSAHQMSFVLAGLIGIVVTTVVGAIAHRVIFRSLEGSLEALLVASLALAVLLQEGAALLWGSEPRNIATPIAGVAELGSIRMSVYRLVVLLISAAGVAIVTVVVYRTSIGRQMRALAQNRSAAETTGVNVNRVSVVAFGIGSALAGLAGALLAGTQPVTPYIGFQPTLVAFTILIVVGVERFSAAIVAGLCVGVLQAVVAGYLSSALQLTAVFVVLLIYLTLRPAGHLAGQR